jgi:predicted glycosyltransferase
MPECDQHQTGENQDYHQVAADRRDFSLLQYARLKPDVLMIETFPFARGGNKDELQPLLDLARGDAGRHPIVLCCMIDIHAANVADPESENQQIVELLEQYFDAVLVYSDPKFARLEEFFQPQKGLTTPIVYTGFLAAGRSTVIPTGAKEKRILVSAGGGASGGPLFRAAIEAHRLLWEAEGLPMTIITGPSLPRTEAQKLMSLSRHSHALTIKRTVPNIGVEMRKVRWSVSQCGYSTAAEVIRSGVAPLFVPSRDERCAGQIERARRLHHWGASRLLVESHLNAASLAHELMQLLRFVPRETGFDMSGSAKTIGLIEKLTTQSGFGYTGGSKKEQAKAVASSKR